LGSEPEVEKTFHDDIDTGSDFADVARTIGAILLGGYIGRKAGKKLGSKLSQLSESVKNVKKTADYQQATTWPQEKQDNPFAIATSQAKDMGYEDFSEGSTGRKKRGEIAEALKEKSTLNKLVKAVKGLQEGLIDGGDIGKPYTDSSKNITEKKDLIPEDYEPPEAFMTKQDCECNETTTGATNITFSNRAN